MTRDELIWMLGIESERETRTTLRMAHTHAKLRMVSLSGRADDAEEIIAAERRREAEQVKPERMLLCPCFTVRYSLRHRWRTFKQTWRKRMQKKEEALGIHLPAVDTEVIVHAGSTFQSNGVSKASSHAASRLMPPLKAFRPRA